MQDNDEIDSAEKFSFVDKRRVSDSSQVMAEPEPVFDTSASTNEDLEPASSPESQASIYDIAAYCMGLLITEGFQRMGIIADPSTGKAVSDLPSARVAIDCVAALVQVLDEPSSTLPEAVRREMKRTLNDLRLNYIDRTRT